MSTASSYDWDSLGSEQMDSRALIAVAEEIREALESDDPAAALDADNDQLEEYREILEAIDRLEAEGIEDWPYGAGFVRADYFETYAQELAEDIGSIDREAAWPLTYIDWEAAADALKQDYSEVTYRGTAYYVR